MAIRLIKLYLPEGTGEEVASALADEEIVTYWSDRVEDDALEVNILPKAEANETVLDTLTERFGSREGFRLLLLPVAASLPHANDEEENDEEEGDAKEEGEEEQKTTRINREELYADAVDSSELTSVYLVLVLLSSVVAAAGMIRNNPTVIIGAMVIAPLLGPNVALSLATTLGDFRLAWRAARISIVGIAAALAFSMVIGWFFSNQLTSPEIASRTGVSLSDIAIALSAGVAGALSFTTGVPAALIGVMVAVALLPPLVSFGMLVGGGHLSPALGALMLFSVNIICVNLAGVATFLAQGIKPASWLEKKNARRATIVSIGLWVTLLAILAAIIIFADPSERLRLQLPDS